GVKGGSGASDDDLASDVLSHYSSTCPLITTALGRAVWRHTDVPLPPVPRSAKTRLAALESLRGAFSSRLLCDFLTERRLTISDCLERSLRKGGGEEQAAAATVCAQLCVQLGGGDESEEGFKILRPVLSAIMIDGCASVAARQSCATALGMCCYVSAAEDGEDLVKSMSHLESVFTTSYPNCEGTLPTPKAGAPKLHSAALHAWALLVTLCPASRLTVLLDLHLLKLQACLESSDVNYRIAVGETIALLVELGRDIDREFEDSDMLCECLKGLATDGNKHRAKNDRRKQRSIFREVLHYIENEDFTEEKIHFGVEGIYIDSWMRRRVYDAFKEVLESGVRHHLQFNPLLRDIFGLGPPLILDSSVKASKISRFEKHLFNSAAFKARTKLRNKVRDKRADVM
uniref:Interferon-related developmental regulator 2 n=1 Tax=Salmo trutta TaxID=8032 RepID=A0A674D6Y5_SALTR